MQEKEKRIHRDVIKWLLLCNTSFEVLSMAIIGFDRKFLAGMLIGTAAVAVNYILLVRVVTCITQLHRVSTGILFELLRIGIFILTMYLCIKTATESIIAYAAAVVGFTFSAVITFARGENDDKF